MNNNRFLYVDVTPEEIYFIICIVQFIIISALLANSLYFSSKIEINSSTYGYF